MSRFVNLLARWPTRRALRVAAGFGLVSVAVIAWGVLQPGPLPVIASMSLGPAAGAVAFLLYALSIAADLAQAWAARPVAVSPPTRR